MLIVALGRLQALYLYLVHLVSFSCYATNLMPCPWGQPNRGSPWKPRRPSVLPLASPSTCSSPSLHPEPILSASPAPPVSQFDNLAIIPRLSCSSSRHLLVPPSIVPPLALVLDSYWKTVGEPPPCRPHNTENQSRDSFFDTQLRKGLAILFGLVFELPQGVEDLQFRLQAMDGKVVFLLQLLSSLQEAFPSDPTGAASTEEPCVAPSEGNAQTQRSARNGMDKSKHEDMAVEVDIARCALQDTSPVVDRTERSMEVGRQWAYVEEEPWSEAVHAT
jgi:hypothetical protein